MTCIACGKPLSFPDDSLEFGGMKLMLHAGCVAVHARREREAKATPKLREDQKMAADPGFWDGFTPWI